MDGLNQDIIFQSRIKAEKLVAYIRVILVLIFLIIAVMILFNIKAQGLSDSEVVRNNIIEFAAIISSIIVTAVSFYFLLKNKYSILMSFLLITHDIIILTVVDYVLSINAPFLSLTTGLITAMVMIVVLSGLRYSFGLSLYSGILASLGYLIVIIINGSDIIRIFGQNISVFTGIGHAGKNVNIYFDMDDITIHFILFNIIGYATGKIASNSKKLIYEQAELASKHSSLQNAFIENSQTSIEANSRSTQSLQDSIEIFDQRMGSLIRILENISSNSRLQNEYISDSVLQLSRIDESFIRIDSEVTNQSGSINIVSEKIARLASNISEINRSTIAAKEESKILADTAHSGQDTVKESISAVKDIEKDSKQIETIIKLITDISDTTNILSMNAAIEAANSGSSGKGFAIIAGEIRKLAINSSQNAKQIKDIINRIIHKIIAAAALSEDVGALIQKILQGIDSVDNLILSISGSAQSQSETASIIENNAGEIVKKTEAIKENIKIERGISNNIIEKVKDVKKIADQTEEEVRNEVELSKDINITVKKISEIVSENRKLAVKLKENLSTYNL